jgi:hypothetical protein
MDRIKWFHHSLMRYQSNYHVERQDGEGLLNFKALINAVNDSEIVVISAHFVLPIAKARVMSLAILLDLQLGRFRNLC